MSLPYEPSYWDGKPMMDALVYPQDENEVLTEAQAEERYLRLVSRVREYLASSDLASELNDDVAIAEFTIRA